MAKAPAFRSTASLTSTKTSTKTTGRLWTDASFVALLGERETLRMEAPDMVRDYPPPYVLKAIADGKGDVIGGVKVLDPKKVAAGVDVVSHASLLVWEGVPVPPAAPAAHQPYAFPASTQAPSAGSASVLIDSGAAYSLDTVLDFTWSGFTDPGAANSGIRRYHFSFLDGGGTSAGTLAAASLCNSTIAGPSTGWWWRAWPGSPSARR